MRREAVRQRDARTYSLRLRGWTLREIADEVGYSSISGVHASVNRARAELVRPAAQHQRDLAGDHLDALTARAWDVLLDPGPTVSAGKVVLDAAGRSIQDRRVLLEALKILVMIDERRARLIGLDAPRRLSVEVVTNEMVDAEIAELTQKLADREARLATGPAGIESGRSS